MRSGGLNSSPGLEAGNSMAGDWIKMRSNIKDDPDVIVMAGRLAIDEFSVIGRLHAVWAWLDQHSESGKNVRITSAYLDRLTACPGFADAMRAVGWLDGRDGDLEFPSFDKHNGQSAKARALSKDRMKRARDRDKANESVTIVTQNASPEKRREEINTIPPTAGEELPNVERAIAQIANAGVPEDFARYAFDDWSSRDGKDGSGVSVTWPRYAKKRWNREGQEWQAGTHKGNKHGKTNSTSRAGSVGRTHDPSGSIASKY